MRVKINNGVPIQLPPKIRTRAQTCHAQKAENVNLEDLDYDIPHTSSIDALLNIILYNHQVLLLNQQ